jgi:hypothetical protein
LQNRRLLLCPAQYYLQELNCSNANICRNSKAQKQKKTLVASNENTKTKTQFFGGFLCTVRYLFSTYIGECQIYWLCLEGRD